MKIIGRYYLIVFCISSLVCASSAIAQQENLGTSFGIPSSSPGVFWPRGSSIESLGFGRLYPNGPEFGLSNTSGGFGLKSSGPVSGVGLTERSVPVFVREQFEHPHTSIQRLTDAFNRERNFSATLFSTAISSQFRAEMQKSPMAKNKEISAPEPPPQLYVLPSIDRILQDEMPNPDTILKTAL